MLIAYIVGILLGLCLIKYIYLVLKRIAMISKIRRKKPDKIVFHRNRLRSVFFPDGKVDMTVKHCGKSYDVSVLTTPFRRVRYHFENDTLEIVVERKSVYYRNYYNRPSSQSHAGTVDTKFVLLKYKLKDMDSQINASERYLILNPVPKFASAVVGTQMVSLDNGDCIANNIKVCGAGYFTDHVLGDER